MKIQNRVGKNKITLIINLVFVGSILFYLFVCFAKSIIKPKEVFESENRYAEKYKDINIHGFLTKSMQDNIEKVLSDQLIFSGKLRSINNLSKAKTALKYIGLFLNDDDLKYLNSNGVSFYGKDNLVYYFRDLDKMTDALDQKVKNYNNLINQHKNIDFYLYYIEKDTDINFITNQKIGIYEYIKSKLDTNNFAKFSIDNFEEFKNYFYETDHHWNYKGSYKGYKEVLKLLGVKDNPLVGEEKCLDIYWSGSKASTSIYNKVLTENFCAYDFTFPKMNVFINGEKSNYGHQEEYIAGNYSNTISYGAFYGGDDGEIIFDTDNKQKGNILIIGESYDNAILKLLASHFNKTISIDLRNYKHYMNREFDFEEYIKKYKIDKVLLIGNVDFYTMEEFFIKGGN